MSHRELKEKQYYAGTLGRDQARRILEQSSPGQFLVRDRAGKSDVHQAPYGKRLFQSTVVLKAFFSCLNVDERTQSAAHDNLQRTVFKSPKILLLRAAQVQ